MAYLVTGGTGFIGARVTRHLVDIGEEVVAFDVQPTPERIANVAEEVTIVRGDIRQVDQLARVFVDHEIDGVAHLAAALTGTCNQEPPMAMAINAVGTANILELADVHGVDAVALASSVAAPGYIDFEEEQTVDADSPRRPSNLYGSTKVLAEDLGEHYADRNGLTVAALRFGSIFGPGRAGGTPVVHLQDLFEKPASGESVTVTGADLRMNWLYVEDAAASVVRALTADREGYDAFNVRDRFASIREMANLVESAVPDADITVVDEPDPAHYPYGTHPKFKMEKTRTVLGFQPEIGIDQGVAEYIEAVSSCE